MHSKSHKRDHLPVFAVWFEVGITTVNLPEIAGQCIEDCLVIRRADSITMIMLLIYMAFILYVVRI